MTLEDIIKTLRTPHDVVPKAALRAAVPHADAMAPRLWDLNARFCRGIKLLPEDEHELFYGLHVLAAAKYLPLWSHLVDLARVEPHELEEFFADHAPISLAAMMLSVWDGDIDRLLRLIEHADLSDNAKWALFDVLARLTAEGRVPRETTHTFLERYERDSLADPDSGLWCGWLSAVTCLGLTDLVPAIDRVLAKPACEIFNDRDRAEQREELRSAAAKPGDLALFDRDGIAPVTDPADALAWIGRRREYLQPRERPKAVRTPSRRTAPTTPRATSASLPKKCIGCVCSSYRGRCRRRR